jgi:pyridoxamine 5'-phosphate oxidase family protein
MKHTAPSFYNMTATTAATFSQREVEYIKSQRLARIATVSPDDLQPDVSPVGFDFDGQYFYVSGKNLPSTRKYKNVLKNNRVGIVIDDLVSVKPWTPRAIRVYGTADIVKRNNGYVGAATYIRIRPERKWNWGIDDPSSSKG